jgi:hypothetical protein
MGRFSGNPWRYSEKMSVLRHTKGGRRENETFSSFHEFFRPFVPPCRASAFDRRAVFDALGEKEKKKSKIKKTLEI